MATEIVQAPSGADRQGMSPADVAAHAAASYVRPTAPPPALAADALSRLELKVAALRYRDASESCSAASAAGNIDVCLAAQDEMRHCLCQLEAAGRLDLVGGV